MKEKNLVVLARGGIGDLILSTPVHRALKQAFPDSHLAVIAKKGFHTLLHHSPVVDEIIPVEEKELDNFSFIFKAKKSGKFRTFQRVVVLWSKAPEALLAYLAGIPIRVGQGSRLFYSFLYTHKVKVRSETGDTETHWTEVMLDYVRALGIEPDRPQLVLKITEDEKEQAAQLLRESGASPNELLIGFHPGKGTDFTPRRIPVSHFAALADALALIPSARLILTGGTKEIELVKAIKEKMTGEAVDLSGKIDLRGLASVISHFKALVCPDSGPMHIGAALGVKIAAVFALKSDFPKRWAPLGVPSQILRPKDWECRKKCVKEECPHLSCYQEISPEDLKIAVGKLLACPPSLPF